MSTPLYVSFVGKKGHDLVYGWVVVGTNGNIDTTDKILQLRQDIEANRNLDADTAVILAFRRLEDTA